jgi:hypothetical protein
MRKLRAAILPAVIGNDTIPETATILRRRKREYAWVHGFGSAG